jgi:23S rRNA (guanosine2251-2'-O)-methyltransferase
LDRLPFRSTQLGRAYHEVAPLPVTFLLDNIRSLFNVGSFFRTADGAGIERLLLTGITGHPPSSEISKTALGADATIPWQHSWDPTPFIVEKRQQGYEIAAIETSAGAVDLFDWQPKFPTCVIFGHETDGIRSHVLDLADTYVRIPMLGTKHSLNVATAAGVVAYELLRKYRARATGL